MRTLATAFILFLLPVLLSGCVYEGRGIPILQEAISQTVIGASKVFPCKSPYEKRYAKREVRTDTFEKWMGRSRWRLNAPNNEAPPELGTTQEVTTEIVWDCPQR